ncbi:hypothetical protein HQ576_15040, partial [bacterium]|nr:hypothetical protein [bacterium]
MNSIVRCACRATVLVALLSGSTLAQPIDPALLGWEVQYLIDQSQTVLGHDQVITPRANRGLALNADATLLY